MGALLEDTIVPSAGGPARPERVEQVTVWPQAESFAKHPTHKYDPQAGRDFLVTIQPQRGVR